MLSTPRITIEFEKPPLIGAAITTTNPYSGVLRMSPIIRVIVHSNLSKGQTSTRVHRKVSTNNSDDDDSEFEARFQAVEVGPGLLAQNETGQKRRDTISARVYTYRFPLSQCGVHEGDRLQSSDNKEVLGPSIGAPQAGAHESVHLVHGRQLRLDIPHHDGRYAHHQAGQGAVHAPTNVQSDRRYARVWTKVRVLPRTVSEYRVSSVQVSVDGSAADACVRLASVRRAPDESGVLRRRFHVHLM